MAAIFTSLPAAGQTGVSTGFDSDNDGWQEFVFFQRLSDVPYQTAGGNPGGYIQITDADASGNIFFSAPSAIQGFDLNTDLAFGYVISFDLRSTAGSSGSAANVRLVVDGLNGSFTVIEGAQPTTDWSTYQFTIDESEPWFVVPTWNTDLASGTRATEADLRGLIGQIGAVYIRADFLPTDGEVTGLDNVGLTVPEPSTAAVFVLAAALAGQRRRRSLV